MNRRHLFWMASWMALGLSACTTIRPPGPAAPDTGRACAEWRWIGISRAGTRCPDVPGWTVRPLFPQIAPAQQREICVGDVKKPEEVASLETIQELNRFCVYELANPKKGLKKVPFPPAVNDDLVRFDRDCAALAVATTPEPAPENWKSLAERFLAQAGKPEEPLEINDRLGVRLAFLDTQPTGMGAPGESGNSPHGHALAHIARELVCTSGPQEHCAAQITTRLALPILEFDPKSPKHYKVDMDRGGFLGMQSDLAQAIRDEVDDWRETKAQRHLVLNLSMAWDGDLFSGLDAAQIGEMQAGTQAIYRALQYAAEFDVLVLAAAGNRKREPCANTGPLLPAAWERGEAREASCGRIRERQPPLLYGVGGVRTDGTPLLNARPGGMPPRAAYGEDAVVPSLDPAIPTAKLTGSSVATAVVSSIAAIVWDTRPELDSHGVMELLAESGDPLKKLKPDFWAGASAPPSAPFPEVHRISLCRALAAACQRNPPPYASCPVRDCKEWEPEEPASDGQDDVTILLGSCQPWLYPQPEVPPCATCVKDPPPYN
ncbi:MAG TPA: S8/S53 family peptidase [Thermoanaerobaculia bacterium]